MIRQSPGAMAPLLTYPVIVNGVKALVAWLSSDTTTFNFISGYLGFTAITFQNEDELKI